MSSAVLAAMEVTPKPGSHSMIKLEKLGILRDEMSVDAAASRRQLGPDVLFESFTSFLIFK